MGDPGDKLVDMEMVKVVPPMGLPCLHLMKPRSLLEGDHQDQTQLQQQTGCHLHLWTLLWTHNWDLLRMEEGGESARLPPIRYASMMFVGEG